MVKHISFILNTTCSSSQIWNYDKCICICENSKHLKHIFDDSVVACDDIIYVINIIPTNMANTIPTNMTSIISANVPKNNEWIVIF